MKEAGYEYVVIDEGWWLGERDSADDIVVNHKQWPAIQPGEKDGDMANIAAYIHSLGLKAGIYTDAGRDGCSMYLTRVQNFRIRAAKVIMTRIFCSFQSGVSTM